MIIIAVILILIGLFVAGASICLWIGIGVLLVGLILNLVPMGENPRRWRYY